MKLELIPIRSLTSLLVATVISLSGAPATLLAAADPTGAQPANSANDGSASNREKSASKILQGQVTYCVPQGTPVKLKLAMVPTSGMHMLDRDLDGKLYPAKMGQVITAKTTEDLYVDDHNVIPEGTVFHGHVSKIHPPRRLGRPGSLEIAFDELETPDGRRFAFQAAADNFKQSTLKTKSKGFGIIAAHAGGGAIVGAMVAYQLFGLKQTIAMHGYNIAGGAAAGALLATGYAIMRKGEKAVLEPGDDLNIRFDTDLLLPAAVEAKAKKQFNNLAGLRIDVQKTKVMNDGLDGHLIRMDARIYNESDKTLKSIDLFMEDTNGNRCPLVCGLEDEAEIIFDVEPHSERQVRLYFQTEYPKLKRRLIWLDHDRRQVCYQSACI